MSDRTGKRGGGPLIIEKGGYRPSRPASKYPPTKKFRNADTLNDRLQVLGSDDVGSSDPQDERLKRED